MNQHADSLKINLQPIGAKPRINHSGWLLSHTMRRSEGEAAKIQTKGRLRESRRLRRHPYFYLSEHPRRRLCRSNRLGPANKTSPVATMYVCESNTIAVQSRSGDFPNLPGRTTLGQGDAIEAGHH